MLKYLIDALQIYLVIFTFIFCFDKYKQRKLSQSLNILKEELDKSIVKKKEIKEEIKEEKETVEYIFYCLSNLKLVKRFVNNLVDLNKYHWCTWEDRTKGTVISIDYQLNGDEWLDLYPSNYLVFNQTHQTFSYLTPQELLIEIDKGIKIYQRRILI